MAELSGLSHPTLVEHNGLLYVSAYRDGAQYLRRSADGGRTWLAFQDENDEKLIARPAAACRAGLLKMDSGGRRLVAAVSTGAGIDIYVSADEGENWVKDSTV
jgi:hypothetical protein